METNRILTGAGENVADSFKAQHEKHRIWGNIMQRLESSPQQEKRRDPFYTTTVQ